MNVRMKGINIGMYCNTGLKSAAQRQERQAKCDSEVAFFEKQKENLKNVGGDSLEDISRKIEMLHSYEEQIAAIKAKFNSEEIYHVLDEAQEFGEKVAKEAEKSKPKTEKERREDLVEDALGTDEDKGELTEELEELTELTEELSEELTEKLDEQAAEQLEELENLDKLKTDGDACAVGAVDEEKQLAELAEAQDVADAVESAGAAGVVDVVENVEATSSVDVVENAEAASVVDALTKKLEEKMAQEQASRYQPFDMRI